MLVLSILKPKRDGISEIIQERFKYAITCSAAYKKEKEIIEKLCTAVLDDLYNLSDRRKQLGLGEQVRK
jgi:hypothetical protein